MYVQAYTHTHTDGAQRICLRIDFDIEKKQLKLLWIHDWNSGFLRKKKYFIENGDKSVTYYNHRTTTTNTQTENFSVFFSRCSCQTNFFQGN